MPARAVAITPAEAAEAYVRHGRSCPKAAAELGIGRETMRRLLDRAGVQRKNPPTDADVLDCFVRTGSKTETARRLHVSKLRVREVVDAADIEAARCTPWTPAEDAVMRELYASARDNGDVSALVAQLPGRSLGALRMRAIELGLTDRNAPKHHHRKLKGKTADELRAILRELEQSKLPVSRFCAQNKIGERMFIEHMRAQIPGDYEAVVARGWSPTGTEYVDGRNCEHMVKNLLARLGLLAFVADRSRGPADVLAISELTGIQYAVQVKQHGALGPAEWNRLMDYAERTGAVPLLASFERGELELWQLVERKVPGRKGVAQPRVRVEFTEHAELVPVDEAARAA